MPNKKNSDQATPSSASLSPRVIKKYPNRRLYDTVTSAYITLADVKCLVMRSVPLVVQDAKTGEDLTRSMLLQIILEEESAGSPMFTEAALANIIRFYGHAMQGLMGGYLEKNMQSFMELQSKLSEQSRTLGQGFGQGLGQNRAQNSNADVWSQFMQIQSPAMQGVMSAYTQQSQQAWSQMQEQMLTAFGVKKN
jgi:polyhydroxyalkanoate synthesis repressor PhaR